MSAAAFPGHVWGPDAEALTAEAPPISAEMVEAFRFSGVVLAEAPDADEEIDTGLIWALRDGARLADVPAAWVSRAVDLLTEGGALLVLANDGQTERDVRGGLLDRLILAETPAAGMGWA